jgi:regulator of sigma D
VDRRRRSREKLDALVSSRTTTLALLTKLAGKQPFTPDHSMEKALREFCEALIDYTASAHFQLYRYLADNRERRQSVISLADELYPRIVETTDQILRFNDKYGACLWITVWNSSPGTCQVWGNVLLTVSCWRTRSSRP